MSIARRVAVAGMGAVLGAALLSGCAAEDPLAPLLDKTIVKEVKLGVDFSDDNAKDTLQRIADQVTAKARGSAGWASYGQDFSNRMLDDIVVVDGDTGARDYGGQVHAASVLASGRQWTATSVGEGNNCWLLRLAGPTSNPTVTYGFRVDKACKASGQAKTTWAGTWPTAPKQEGVTSTVPPSPGATGSVTSTVPPSPGATGSVTSTVPPSPTPAPSSPSIG